MNAFAKYIAAQLITDFGKAKAVEVVKFNLRKKVADSFASLGGVHSMAWFDARAKTNDTDKQIMQSIYSEVTAL